MRGIQTTLFDQKENKKHRYQVWSYGGGTQSVAIAALIIQGRLPKPDYSVIADTGMEKQSTWYYMDSVVNPAMREVGLEIERVCRFNNEAEWTKGEVSGCFSKKGDIMIPVYTKIGSVSGKLSGFCSSAWKKEVVNRHLSIAHGVTPKNMCRWLGFSTDEPRRFIKHVESDEVWLPLVLGVPLSRDQCVKTVLDMGWPTPPRSNCWMCPNQSNDEWLETKENRPDEFEKAVQIERQVRAIDPEAWFHWQCVPLDKVDWSISKKSKVMPCNSGECFL